MNKIVKRGLHILIISAITAMFGVLTVFGVSAEVGDTFIVNTVEGCPITYKVISEGAFLEVEVSYCSDYYEGAVTLPDYVENPNNSLEYSVTSIGDDAFKGCFMLKNVTIPDSVTIIGDCAFFYCTSLTSITIPDSVTIIGDWAFEVCSSLTSITIPDSVTIIGDCAFEYCESLTSVTIPESVTSIGSWTFYHCDSLTSIEIPESVTSIGDHAFDSCGSLSEMHCDGLEPPCLGEYVFYDCPSDLKIYIPFGTKDAYVTAGWPEDNFVDIFIKSVKVVDENGKPIEGAKVMIYLKEYTPFALTGGYTNSEGIYTCPADTPCDTVEVKKSGYKQVDARVSDNFEIVVVMVKI